MSEYNHCTAQTDAWVMERKLVRKRWSCPTYILINISGLEERLRAGGCGVLLINVLPYRNHEQLPLCMRCVYYKGEYLTGKEVLGR